ncbi:MAG: TetR/AcrR family transcriptional regulator [Acidimicrobiia bacterium]
MARHRAFLDAALRIATEESLHALTMQRLADEVDAAVGTVYTYFPSKGALVAEVQREAVDRLTASYLLLRPRIEDRVADAPPEVAALAHLVGFARFTIESVTALPQEQRLLQQLMYDADQLVPTEEGARVLPSVMRLLEMARQRFEVAAATGALSPADPMERTVVLAAALNGVLQVGKLARWDPDLLQGPRLAGQLVDDLLAGWGARPEVLLAAHAVVDAIARRQPLARPVDDDTTAAALAALVAPAPPAVPVPPVTAARRRSGGSPR